MKIVIASVFFAFALITAAQAGNCDHSWETASDGSRCGDRAADRRSGGK